jgi:zinc-ribbon domain
MPLDDLFSDLPVITAEDALEIERVPRARIQAALETSRARCPFCGKEPQPDDPFCGHCGTRIVP